MKTEFAQIISEIKEVMNLKSELLRSSEDFNAHSQGKINNIQSRVVGLESSADDIVKNYAGHPEMRINFRKRANEIRKEIEGLTC